MNTVRRIAPDGFKLLSTGDVGPCSLRGHFVVLVVAAPAQLWAACVGLWPAR